MQKLWHGELMQDFKTGEVGERDNWWVYPRDERCRERVDRDRLSEETFVKPMGKRPDRGQIAEDQKEGAGTVPDLRNVIAGRTVCETMSNAFGVDNAR
jgi:hypothetical protein